VQVTDPLEHLHPLREPPPVSWWPPAPGWWLLAGLLLLALAGLGWWLWRRYRQRRYRREAVARLDALHAERTEHPNETFGAACNRLLKAVALRSFAPQEVAALSGDAWVDFLNATAPRRDRPLFAPDFARELYQPGLADAERDSVYQATRRWILYHGGRQHGGRQ
jgi:hypothetical protein